LYIARVVLDSIFAKMSSESWQNFGNIVNTAGLAGFAITGATSVLAGYQAYASPLSSLAESEKKLKSVRSRLQELSPQRREEIDSRCRASNCKSLKDLEGELDMCVLLNDDISRSNSNLWPGL
jgi:hypothetical protein